MLPGAMVYSIGKNGSACALMSQRLLSNFHTAFARYCAPSTVKCTPSEMRICTMLPCASGNDSE